MSTPVFTLHPGDSAVLVSVPHVGTQIPVDQMARYVPRALDVEDTDWHLDRLYGFVRTLGAGLIVPRYSRFLIDLNRAPDDRPMYAGANNTELCPTRFFSGEPIYRDGQAPDMAEIARRREAYWRPYHDAIRNELERLRRMHGFPWLFDGKLPDLNLGTASGASCAPSLRRQLAGVLQQQQTYTQVVDGRFKGGYITRSFGQPQDNIHAVQLEMCWSTYMNETPPYALDPQRAAGIEPVLRTLVQTMRDWRPDA